MPSDTNLHELPGATMTRTHILMNGEQKLDLVTRNLTPQEDALGAEIVECWERHGA